MPSASEICSMMGTINITRTPSASEICSFEGIEPVLWIWNKTPSNTTRKPENSTFKEREKKHISITKKKASYWTSTALTCLPVSEAKGSQDAS